MTSSSSACSESIGHCRIRIILIRKRSRTGLHRDILSPSTFRKEKAVTERTAGRLRQRDEVYDLDLRRHMLNVYNYMICGLIITSITSMLFAASGLTEMLFNAKGSMNLFGFLLVFSPLAYVFFLKHSVERLSLGAAQMTYWSFTALMGASLSTIFLAYTSASIATAFLATAAAFCGLSLYGYTTKRDLGPIGQVLIMCVWGIIAALVLNLFLGSEPMAMVISTISVVVFAGLTAYDTQKIKRNFTAGWGRDTNERLAIMGALTLYLDFINMALHLLRLFGTRR